MNSATFSRLCKITELLVLLTGAFGLVYLLGSSPDTHKIVQFPVHIDTTIDHGNITVYRFHDRVGDTGSFLDFQYRFSTGDIVRPEIQDQLKLEPNTLNYRQYINETLNSKKGSDYGDYSLQVPQLTE